jgi:hypothetical protein
VHETNQVPTSTVYPNPTSNGHLFVQADENVVSVELLNLVGQKLACETSTLNSRLVQVSTASQSPGLYFVRVNFSNKRSAVHRVTIR